MRATMRAISQSLLFQLCVASSSLLISCITEDPSQSTPVTSEQAPPEIANIRQLPHRAVCPDTGSRFHCYAHVLTNAAGHIQPFAGAGGYGPSDLQSAYNL